MIDMQTIATDDIYTPAQYLATRIRARLDAEQSVLWLVSGGSAIGVAVQARQLLGPLRITDKLEVALVDERYGEIDHADSNTRQLLDAGFDLAGLTYSPILIGQDIKSTSRAYGRTIRRLSRKTDVTIGLFGVGSDGHTAGLLPSSPLMHAVSFVGYFDGHDYQRITITPRFIRQVDEAILYAVGQAKWPVVADLQATDLPVSCLRRAHSLKVMTDYQTRQP